MAKKITLTAEASKILAALAENHNMSASEFIKSFLDHPLLIKLDHRDSAMVPNGLTACVTVEIKDVKREERERCCAKTSSGSRCTHKAKRYGNGGGLCDRHWHIEMKKRRLE